MTKNITLRLFKDLMNMHHLAQRMIYGKSAIRQKYSKLRREVR